MNLYLTGKVDDPKAIKVVGCHNEDAKQVIKDLQDVKVVTLNESGYLLFFSTEEALIQFFKNKVEQRYRFYLHEFENRKPRDQREGKPRDQRDQREGKPK